MSCDDNLNLVLAYIACINGGDVEGALALAADNVVFQGPDGSTMDKAGLRALFAAVKPLLINPIEARIRGTTCQGNRVAIEMTGNTLLANGRTYSNIYHFLFEVNDGQITAAREYCDTTRASAFGGV